ncbi:MAG: hypothetical protein IPI60_16935 [Saprospiraceae bacterium]|nr:hypothetical protein [Saprospiraceae bacterium]
MNRSATETPVAIDIIPIAELINSTGQLDINQLLQYAAPSFNSNRQSGADGKRPRRSCNFKIGALTKRWF